MTTTRTLQHGALLLTATLALAGCGRDNPEQRLERAAEQYAAGDLRTASVELRNVLQSDPENVEARVLFGRTALAMGDAQTAERQFSQARALGAGTRVHVPMARALAQLGRGADALDDLDAVPDAERDADWYAVRGEVLMAEGDRDAAVQAFERALELDGRHYGATTGLAAAEAQAGNLPAARRLAQSAIDIDPDRPEAHLLYATLNIQAGQLRAGADSLHAAVEAMRRGVVTPREIAALASLVQAQLALGDTEGLSQSVNRLNRRAPDTPMAHYAEGALAFLEGRHADANLKLQQAAASAPDSEQIMLLRASNHLALGNLGQAEQEANRVLTQRPGDLMASRVLAEARRRQGRPDAALAALGDVGGGQQQPSLLALRGVLHVEAGQPEQGVLMLEQAAQALPGDAGVQLQLARAYLAAGRPGDATRLFDGPVGPGAEDALTTAIELLAAYADDRDDGRARAEAALSAGEDDPQTLMGVALFHQATGQSDEARALLRRAMDAEPAAAPRLLLAGLEMAAGRGDAARELYEEVAERHPDNFRGALGLGHIAAGEGALDEAQTHARRAADTAADELAPQLFLAQLALRQGDVNGAAEALSRARRIDAEDPNVLTLAAVVAIQQGDGEAALADFRRAAQLQPGRADRWFNLAGAQQSAGELDGAVESLTRALEIAPSAGPPRLTLAQVELQRGNADEALLHARRLQADFPDAAPGYLTAGNALASQGEYAAAAAAYERAVDRGAGYEAALGLYRVRRVGGFGDAAEPLQRWLEQSPDDLRAHLALAEYHQTNARSREALESYERVLEGHPDHVIALNNAAWLYAEADDPRGVELARRAVQLAPQAAPVLDTYGWALVRQGRVDEGLPYLRDAAERAPGADDIQYHLAYALARTGERDEARDILSRLLADADEFSYREQAQGLLQEL